MLFVSPQWNAPKEKLWVKSSWELFCFLFLFCVQVHGVTFWSFLFSYHPTRFHLFLRLQQKKKRKLVGYQFGAKMPTVVHIYNHPKAEIHGCIMLLGLTSTPLHWFWVFSRSEGTGPRIPGFFFLSFFLILIQGHDHWFLRVGKGRREPSIDRLPPILSWPGLNL